MLTDAVADSTLHKPTECSCTASATAVQVGVSLESYLNHLTRVAGSSSAASSNGAVSSAEQNPVGFLQTQLDAIDKYGQEGASKVDEKEVCAAADTNLDDLHRSLTHISLL